MSISRTRGASAAAPGGAITVIGRTSRLGEVDRGRQRGQLVHALHVLAGGIGVGHDARAGLQQGHAVAHDDRAQRDAGVERAVEADVAERAGIDPAAGALDGGDQLHGAHLGRAADRARGERRLQQRERVLALAQVAVDLRDEVHDVRVALDLEQLGDAHAAGLADAAEVVARQVDEHQMLGALLLVGLELVRERVVGGAVGVAPRVPAIGLSVATPARESETCVSGEADTIWRSPRSQNTM